MHSFPANSILQDKLNTDLFKLQSSLVRSLILSSTKSICICYVCVKDNEKSSYTNTPMFVPFDAHIRESQCQAPDYSPQQKSKSDYKGQASGCAPVPC